MLSIFQVPKGARLIAIRIPSNKPRPLLASLLLGLLVVSIPSTGIPQVADALPPLANLEPEKGTICFGCVEPKYRLRANLDWERVTGATREDLDLHTLRYLPDPEKVIVSHENREKYLPLKGDGNSAFGWLDCDDVGHDRSDGCEDRFGEDFRVRNIDSTSGALRYCFAIIQYGSSGASQPFTFRITSGDESHVYQGQLNPFGSTESSGRQRACLLYTSHAADE